MTDYSADLDLALHLAEISDEITMDRYGSDNLVVDSKPDLTPVTDADLAVERRIRDEIQAYRSDDAILGEEFGGEVELNGRQWVIDPIDGTKNFVRDTPVWATLISLLDNGEPVVGVISAPALARRWWATKDMGAWRSFNGKAKELRTSFVTDVSDSSISISSLIGWKEIGLRDQLIDFTDKAWRLRGYGDFYSYCLVAQGSVDIAMEPAVNLWDLAAPAILVREAGGEFTSITGEPGPNHGSALATNGKLHQAALDALKK